MPALLGLPDGEGETAFGQFFIMICYGFILFKAAVLIGDASEKLLLIYGPGIVGGLLIPILGAVPDAAIVLVSGLGSNAQCQVSTGVGTLAGSTIMLLTIPWGIGLLLACRDKDEDGNAAIKENGKPKYTGFKLFESCVTPYNNTMYVAKISIITSVSYLIVLIPSIIYKTASSDKQREVEHYPALVGLIVCGLAFIAYSIFQLLDSKLSMDQRLKQNKLQFLRWRDSVGHKVANMDNGIRLAFERFDKDKDDTINKKELQEGFACLGLDLDRKQINEMMASHQTDDETDTLSFGEFSDMIKKWSRTIISKQQVGFREVMHRSRRILPNIPENSEEKELSDAKKDEEHKIAVKDSSPLLKANKNKSNKEQKNYSSMKDDRKETEKEKEKERKGYNILSTDEKLLDSMWQELENAEGEEEEESEEHYFEYSDMQLILNACAILILGTALVVIFSDPMVAVIGAFSNSININSFYVSFIITPIASNASEIYASLLFAKKKTTEGISMGFSSLYGAACMNNTLVLCIFCMLVFIKKLQWTFVAETLVILITILFVGLNGLKRTIDVWQAFGVILLFPLSLILVALLDPLLDDKTSC